MENFTISNIFFFFILKCSKILIIQTSKFYGYLEIFKIYKFPIFKFYTNMSTNLMNSFLGQYVTLSILKSFKNGNNVVISKIVGDDKTVNIPATVIQIGPSSNYDSYPEQINFKAQKHLSVHYYTDDDQLHVTKLQHLKQVHH